ncbi:hypothetical protein SUGI_0255920 [Cryptomeria japonica]|nr:hypothetical protein SUGI_0255920 [Cryptomeria japonica]
MVYQNCCNGRSKQESGYSRRLLIQERLQKKEQFLVPVVTGYLGINNQLMEYMSAAVIARATGKTLCLPLLFRGPLKHQGLFPGHGWRGAFLAVSAFLKPSECLSAAVSALQARAFGPGKPNFLGVGL